MPNDEKVIPFLEEVPLKEQKTDSFTLQVKTSKEGVVYTDSVPVFSRKKS